MLERLSRTPGRALALVLLILAVTALVLRAMGHSFVCPCGQVRLWYGEVMTAQNSQHLLDWYSFSHLMFGMLVYGGMRMLLPEWSLRKRLVVTAMIAAGWEIGENTPFLIDRYRDVTVSVNYTGDSVLNALGDTLAALAGFALAATLPVWGSAALFVAVEALTLWMARDGLLLSVLMVTAPLDVIRHWQAGA